MPTEESIDDISESYMHIIYFLAIAPYYSFSRRRLVICLYFRLRPVTLPSPAILFPIDVFSPPLPRRD